MWDVQESTKPPKTYFSLEEAITKTALDLRSGERGLAFIIGTEGRVCLLTSNQDQAHIQKKEFLETLRWLRILEAPNKTVQCSEMGILEKRCMIHKVLNVDGGSASEVE